MTLRVLVIDDEAAIREMLDLVLTLEGCEVHTAPDGLAGLEVARSVNPDVILLDVMMPGLTGREVAPLLRECPELAETPIIFCSALAGEEDTWAGYQAGATSYIPKPFDSDIVVSEVFNAVRGRRPSMAV